MNVKYIFRDGNEIVIQYYCDVNNYRDHLLITVSN